MLQNRSVSHCTKQPQLSKKNITKKKKPKSLTVGGGVSKGGMSMLTDSMVFFKASLLLNFWTLIYLVLLFFVDPFNED